jgi:hypothetical protein
MACRRRAGSDSFQTATYRLTRFSMDVMVVFLLDEQEYATRGHLSTTSQVSAAGRCVNRLTERAARVE